MILPTIDVDLSLEADDEEPCIYGLDCSKVATWEVEADSACEDWPRVVGACEEHAAVAIDFRARYGSKGWSCNMCGHVATIIDIRRKRR